MRARIWVGIALVWSQTVGAGLAFAEQAPRAADGQSLEGQSSRTQQTFVGMYGAGCAAQEWAWQHDLEVHGSMVDGPPASDGQKLTDQDDDIQLAFVAVWGPAAVKEWIAEHNAVIARRVLPAPVTGIPCPAVRVSSADAIDTAHLVDAVVAASAEKLPEAHGNLKQFRDLWNTTKGDIRRLSPAVTDAVQAAYDQAAAVISDPSRPAPRQSEYLPVLQSLLKAVQSANTTLAGGAEIAGGGGVAPQVRPGNLAESVDWATKANLANARDEFGQFQRDWAQVKDAFRARFSAVADRVEAAIAQVSQLIGDAGAKPPQAQYLGALRNLQQVVQAANDEVSR